MTVTQENYLEIMLDIECEMGKIKSIELAKRIGVSRASVNKAIGVLKGTGMVTQEYYGEIKLTLKGRNYAAYIRRHHDIIREFLIKALGLSEGAADVDACRIEHVVSEEMIAAIEEFNKK